MQKTLPRVVVPAALLPATFPKSAFEGQIVLQTVSTDDELREASRDATILYTGRIPRSVPASTPRLRWIQLPSAGADAFRHLPVWDSDVILTSSTGIHTVPMSEHFFAMLLALVRQIPPLLRAQDRHEWIQDISGAHLRFGELRGKTIGIAGWGKIGDGIAHLARSFGMRVIGTRWSVLVPRGIQGSGSAYSQPPWLEPVETPPDIMYPAAQLHEVLSGSDIVVLILPLTAETESSFGDAEFNAMKRGALFFNIGRGKVVNEAALVRALQSGKLGGAGLDVYESEPLPRTSPLWAMPNVIVSPHVGGASEVTRQRGARFFAVNLSRYLEGKELLNVVNRREGY